VIGHDIVVTVLEVRSDQVRIGIDAPREVSVHREEVYRQMVAENSAAVVSAGADRAEALRRRLRQARPRPGGAPAPGTAPSAPPAATGEAAPPAVE